MANGKNSWLPPHVREMGGDLAEMLDLRRQLAESEIRQDVNSGKRLAVIAGLGAAIAIVGASLLTVVLAGRADAALASSTGAFPHVSFWLSLLLIACGGLTAWAGVRRFRRSFCGLRESLAELKEDLLWLREWCETDKDAAS